MVCHIIVVATTVVAKTPTQCSGWDLEVGISGIETSGETSEETSGIETSGIETSSLETGLEIETGSSPFSHFSFSKPVQQANIEILQKIQLRDL